MHIDLKDKIVLVTGAASGIGRASALAAHGCGARVIVADKTFHEAAQISSGLAGSVAVGFDVTDERQVAQEVSRIEDDIGPIDGLVHAAGVLQRPLPPHQLTMREWDIVNQVDFRGSYIVAASVGSLMAKRGAGSIVLVASVGGLCSGRLHAYNPAKAAVLSMTQNLAAEWGRSGVRVNAVSPGFTETPALDRGMKSGIMNSAAMTSATAMGRLLTVDEVSAPIVFLLSDLSSGMTGGNVLVDAGYLAASGWSGFGGVPSGQQST
jgi:NAD(P)-dependent dehydrogenase (short-subunit alcohol dehydrogenase family)